MYANWKKCHKGGDLQKLLWSCVKATTEPQFEICANRTAKLKGDAYNDLMTKDPRYWSKAFFSSRSRCDAVVNNFFEAFNSAILGARYKYVISMFEDTRYYVMHMIVEHKKSLKWKGEVEGATSQAMPTMAHSQASSTVTASQPMPTTTSSEPMVFMPTPSIYP
ncbi:hypothetical protein V6N13_030631 [Hibiscus sabdariffa]